MSDAPPTDNKVRKKLMPSRTAGPGYKELAQKLHDGPCQTITGAYFLGQSLLQKQKSNRGCRIEEIQELTTLIHRASRELREILALLSSQQSGELREEKDLPKNGIRKEGRRGSTRSR